MLAFAGCSGGSDGEGSAAASASTATAPAPSPSPSPSPAGTPTVIRTVFLAGLQNPWDMAFTPDGAMLYTERARGLSVRLADGSTRLLYAPADLAPEGQNGLHGVTLDPQFTANRTIYVYLASRAGGAVDNRVIALVVEAGYTAVRGRRDIVTGITNANGAHSGGRIRFGPDGYLYITTGDTRQGPVPQDLTRLGGKVLRVDRDGNAAGGNAAGGDPRIFAFGFRNVQGIDFRPATGVPYISEHGPGYTDEVTPLVAGGNGGWDPRCADGVSYCGYDGITRMTDTRKFPAALAPAWSSGTVSRGTAGGAFLRGSAWRDWNGAFVVAQLSGLRLEVLQLNAAGTSALAALVFDSLGVRLRAVVAGPDGALYLSTDGKAGGDEIWRVVPTE